MLEVILYIISLERGELIDALLSLYLVGLIRMELHIHLSGGLSCPTTISRQKGTMIPKEIHTPLRKDSTASERMNPAEPSTLMRTATPE